MGILAALPGELKPLLAAGFAPAPTRQKHARKWTLSRGPEIWIAVCAGMGADAARRALAEAESDGPLDLLLSVGWAGALTDQLTPGATYRATGVVDAQTGERFEVARGHRHNPGPELVLVSTAGVAGPDEKSRLRAAYRASMVDMESATLARLAEARGIPVGCFKAISDTADQRLPDFQRFIDLSGQMRLAPFVAHVLLRPKYWGALVRLGRSSRAGAATLAAAILSFLGGSSEATHRNPSGNVDW